MHFKDCDEVVGITRLNGFRPSQTGTKIGAEMKQILYWAVNQISLVDQ